MRGNYLKRRSRGWRIRVLKKLKYKTENIMSGRIQIENLSKVFGGNDEEKVVALLSINSQIKIEI